MKIKNRFPQAGSNVIVDARWLGYQTTNRKDNLTFDPIYIRKLTDVYLSNPVATLGVACSCLPTIIPLFVDERNGHIRGNAFPMDNSIAVALNKITQHVTANTALTWDEASVFSIMIARALAAAQIIELSEGSLVHDLYCINDPLPPFFAATTKKSILGRLLMADGIAAACEEFLANVVQNMRPVIKADKGGFRNADVMSIVDAITRAVDLFDLNVRKVRSQLMPYARSAYVVFCTAVSNPEYTPIGLSDGELNTLMSYANCYFDFRWNPLVPSPALIDEKRTAACLQLLQKAINKESVSLFRVQKSSELQRGIEQFSVRMPADSDVTAYVKTSWMIPAGAQYHAGVVIPYKNGVHSIATDTALGSSFQKFFATLERVSDYVNEEYNRSHFSVDGYTTEPAINQLASASGYDAHFAAKVLQTIAMDVCRDFSLMIETGVLSYTYMDTINRHSYNSVMGGELRERATEEASEVLAHTSLTNANGETFWKKPSVFGVMPSAVTYVTKMDENMSRMKEIVGHTALTDDGALVPADNVISFVMKLPSGKEVPAEFRIHELIDRDLFAIADTYLEKDATLDLTDARLSSLLTEILAMPEGKMQEKFIVDIVRIIDRAANEIFGDDLYRATQRFTAFPRSYWSTFADQSLKLIRMQNSVNAMIAMMVYLDFTSAANLSAVAKEAFKLPAEQILGE
jgi:hypothetical protein